MTRSWLNHAGTRIDTPTTQVRVVVAEMPTVSYHFPVRGDTPAESRSRMQRGAEAIQAVLAHLRDTCGGCGWFVGEPDISILAIVGGCPSRNALARPGTEHLHVLPVDEDQVMEWVEDGSLERRRVLLTDTKGLSLTLSLSLSLSLSRWYGCGLAPSVSPFLFYQRHGCWLALFLFLFLCGRGVDEEGPKDCRSLRKEPGLRPSAGCPTSFLCCIAHCIERIV